jgi:hypothetical protein
LPGGASEGSVRLGLVTSTDGSLINCCLSMSSSNTPRHERPKWMLWWAIFEYDWVDPASMRKHDGE